MTIGHHIQNPIEWGWDLLKNAKFALGSATHAIHGSDQVLQANLLAVRRITSADIRDALARGLADFGACRTDVIFLCLIYPVAGLLLSRLAVGYDMVPLIFPLASGFALLGPVAAMGLYEMSRRREQGTAVSWADAFGVVGSPAFGALIALSIGLLVVFMAWLVAAYAIYAVTLGPAPPASITAFARDVFTTPAGWAMTVVGIGVGFVFAVLVLAISVVSFPLLLDRDVGLSVAVGTSIRAVRANPGPMAIWGAVVVGGLVIGSIPLLVGLAIVMPVLGHATWHLYRKLVV